MCALLLFIGPRLEVMVIDRSEDLGPCREERIHVDITLKNYRFLQLHLDISERSDVEERKSVKAEFLGMLEDLALNPSQGRWHNNRETGESLRCEFEVHISPQRRAHRLIPLAANCRSRWRPKRVR